MKAKLYIVFIYLMLNSTIAFAQSFRTEQLKQAALTLGIESGLDSIKPNQTLEFTLKDGQNIIIRADKQQRIEHLGIPLFNDSLRILMPSPVYDFMEYAVLNWKYKITPNTLYLSKVLFRKGSWNSLTNNRLYECDCSIENVDDKLYIVTWKRDSIDVAIIGIPIDYELLCNESRRNIEQNFINNLERHQVSDNYRFHRTVTEKDLKIYGTEGLFVIQGKSYLFPEVNQNIYYVLKTVFEPADMIHNNVPVHVILEDVLPVLVSENEHVAETFANIMISNDTDMPNPQIDLDIHLSDYRHKIISLPLSSLKSYCKEQGDDIYFAFTGLAGDNAKGILFMNNPSKGYNHLFSVTVPRLALTETNPVMKVNAYLFIPPISKEKLFGKTPTKKSGAKIY